MPPADRLAVADPDDRCRKQDVPGFHLTMLELFTVSVGMAMRHAVSPNEPWLTERGMAASWTNEAVIDVTDVTPAIRAFD